MSGFLFLLALDWIMSKVTADKRREIRWKFTTVLEDLDFADDIALLSSKFNDLREKTGRLTEEAARSGLKLNARKCKTLKTEQASNRESIVVDTREVEDVEEFCYALVFDKHIQDGCTTTTLSLLLKSRPYI